MNTHLRRLAVVAFVLIGGSATALADPPGRVGRLSDIEGAVSLHQPDQAEWSQANVNYPVIAGDALWTSQASRAEIQVGPAEIRMDEQTEIDVLRLDEAASQFRLDEGAINVHLMIVPPGGLQIITAGGQMDLLRPGNYHLEVGRPFANAPPAPIQIAVLNGEARLTNARATTTIPAGQTAVVAPDQSSLNFVPATMTSFDAWALDRERLEAASQAVQYVSPEMTGYQDLDRYGQWTSLPDYGTAWIPSTVAADWAPYRFGHWAYVTPWGWTWIDDAPWGFTPFHYGRWVQFEGRWAWCPGRQAERPVYAPALVAFIGSPGASIGIAIGHEDRPAVGWVPLAPHEVFHPYYPASDHYVREVNVNHISNVAEITTVTNVTVNNYANHRAATVVPNAAFTGAAPIRHAVLTVPPEQFAHAPVNNAVGHLQPSPAALHQVAPPHGPGPAVERPDGWHPQGQPQPQQMQQMQQLQQMQRHEPPPQPAAVTQPPRPQPQPQQMQQLQQLQQMQRHEPPPQPAAVTQPPRPQPQPQQMQQMQRHEPLPQPAAVTQPPRPQPQPQPQQMQQLQQMQRHEPAGPQPHEGQHPNAPHGEHHDDHHDEHHHDGDERH